MTKRLPPHMSPNQIQVIDRYRTHLLAAGRGAGTIHLRISHLEHLTREYPELVTVTRGQLEGYLATRRNTHSAATRKSIQASFKTFYAWAFREELIPADPAATLMPIRSQVKPARVARDEDLWEALEHASIEDRAVLMLARLACLRRSEIAALHTNDREGAALRILGKGQKTRIVKLNADLLEVLLELELTRHGYYFPGRFSGHRHSDSIYDVIKRLAHTNPHSLRHAGASAAYKKTHDIAALQEMLGHADLSTTRRYVTLADDALQRIADATSLDPSKRPASA